MTILDAVVRAVSTNGTRSRGGIGDGGWWWWSSPDVISRRPWPVPSSNRDPDPHGQKGPPRFPPRLFLSSSIARPHHDSPDRKDIVAHWYVHPIIRHPSIMGLADMRTDPTVDPPLSICTSRPRPTSLSNSLYIPSEVLPRAWRDGHRPTCIDNSP